MVAGVTPIRAEKARDYVDAKFTERILPPPETKPLDDKHRSKDDWTVLPAIAAPASATPKAAAPPSTTSDSASAGSDGVSDVPAENLESSTSELSDSANGGIRRDTELGEHEDVATRSEEHTSELQSLMRISYA